jgi:hypothetical protein
MMDRSSADEMIARIGEGAGEVKKQSIAVLREATRGSGASSNTDLERVARSIMLAAG